MKSAVLRTALGLAFVAALSGAAVHAEEGVKALPTLLIKGEVVSLDTNDPSATLLTVKDRYGFETPIYLMAETKISESEQTVDTSKLTTGAAVEVEYNFDVNTAKRHAVSVKLASAAAAPAAAPAEGAAAIPEAVPAPAVPSEPLAQPATPAAAPEASAPSAEGMAETEVTPPTP